MRRIFGKLLGRRDAGCEHTSRGLARFDEVLRSAGLPSLDEAVSERARPARKVTILEVGCGEGRLLLDVEARFGDAVELHGINLPGWPVVADAQGLLATNARYRILPPNELQRSGAPTIHLADAQDLSGFPVGPFDLIVSQVVLPHVAHKARVLEESARLLAPGGTFFHELDNFDGREPEFLAADLPRLSIEERGARISTTGYLERRGVRVRRGRVKGRTVPLVTFRKADGVLDLGLVLDEGATVVLKSIATLDAAHRWGVRSVYRTRADAAAGGGPVIHPRGESGSRPAPPAEQGTHPPRGSGS